MVMSVPRQNTEKCSKFTEIGRKKFFLLFSFENNFLKKFKHGFWSIFENLKLNQTSEFQSYYI